MATTPSMVLAGAGMVAACAGIAVASRRPADPGPRPLSPEGATRRPRLSSATLAGLGVGVATGILTRWPAAALLAAVATAGLPALLGATRSNKATERIEAVAAWTELLRDTLAAASGLGQAIVATAELAPRPIRPAVMALAERLASGVPMEEALRALATELDDPSADLVVCALLVAASARTQRLTELLGALAESSREEVAMRLRVEASRASARSSVRTVILFSVGFAALLFVVAHSYLAPFGSATGQVVLVVIGACYATGLLLMVRLVRPRPPFRLLDPGSGS